MATHDLQRGPRAARDLLASIRQLGQLRRANPWLTSATLADVHVQHGGLTYTTTDGSCSLHVCLNPTAAPLTLATRSADHVEVAPRSWVIRPA